MAVEEVMGCGEEAEVRRKRVEELGEMAKRAVQESGSSFQDMDSLIEVLMEMKTWSAEISQLKLEILKPLQLKLSNGLSRHGIGPA
ncbi:hypothetical protein J5N97_003962 [Dioscorea zingiberensis]|uniref:Uncharacterized protein n=1 Tax=Dioscorea zingiberensis TaxID=325984 RepID=A0A9D5HR60_9LILI|nr:hypothetical protein J5N97_003962 [Dioscorea zingiberensis]